MQDNKDLVRQQFGTFAERYVSSQDHAQSPTLERLVVLTQPQKAWRVLDVSTGGGHTARRFAPLVQTVVASDLSPDMLAAAERAMRDKGVQNVEFKVADAEDLPFEDGEFDLVTNRIALHHFANPPRALRETARVLMPGGLFGLIDNIVPPDPDIAGYVNAFEKIHDPSHEWCYPQAELEAMVKDAGLEIVHTENDSKDRNLETWADRSGCSETVKRQLRALLRVAPPGVTAFLKPRINGAQMSFSLTEVVLVAKKA